jgi:hypothetical protein
MTAGLARRDSGGQNKTARNGLTARGQTERRDRQGQRRGICKYLVRCVRERRRQRQQQTGDERGCAVGAEPGASSASSGAAAVPATVQNQRNTISACAGSTPAFSTRRETGEQRGGRETGRFLRRRSPAARSRPASQYAMPCVPTSADAGERASQTTTKSNLPKTPSSAAPVDYRGAADGGRARDRIEDHAERAERLAAPLWPEAEQDHVAGSQLHVYAAALPWINFSPWQEARRSTGRSPDSVRAACP